MHSSSSVELGKKGGFLLTAVVVKRTSTSVRNTMCVESCAQTGQHDAHGRDDTPRITSFPGEGVLSCTSSLAPHHLHPHLFFLLFLLLLPFRTGGFAYLPISRLADVALFLLLGLGRWPRT